MAETTAPGYEFIRYEIADEIAVITLARPPVNALTLAFVDELLHALSRVREDDAVRAVIIESAFERVFCAGLDLTVVAGRSMIEVRRFLEGLYMALYDLQYRLDKPSVAAVRGANRAGGMTVMLSCDCIIAGEQTTFGYPEVKVGLIPALHLVHLPRQAGRYRAFPPLFTGEAFSVQDADRLGLISRIVPEDDVCRSAREMAKQLIRVPPTIMKMGRHAFMRANDLDYRRGIENMADTFAALVETEETQSLLRAFVDKENS